MGWRRRPLQQYLVEFPGGRLQALSLAWDTRPQEAGGQRWFYLYPGETLRPSERTVSRGWSLPSGTPRKKVVKSCVGGVLSLDRSLLSARAC
jgi:hypothetical protein